MKWSAGTRFLRLPIDPSASSLCSSGRDDRLEVAGRFGRDGILLRPCLCVISSPPGPVRAAKRLTGESEEPIAGTLGVSKVFGDQESVVVVQGKSAVARSIWFSVQ